MTVYIYHSVCDNLLCSQGISWAVFLSEAGSLFQAHVTDRFQDVADVIRKSLFSCWLSSEASSQLLDAAHGSLPYGPLTASHNGGFLPQGQQRSILIPFSGGRNLDTTKDLTMRCAHCCYTHTHIHTHP